MDILKWIERGFEAIRDWRPPPDRSGIVELDREWLVLDQYGCVAARVPKGGRFLRLRRELWEATC